MNYACLPRLQAQATTSTAPTPSMEHNDCRLYFFNTCVIFMSFWCVYLQVYLHSCKTKQDNKTKSLNLIILFPFSQLFSRFPLILDKIQIPFLTYKAQHNPASTYCTFPLHTPTSVTLAFSLESGQFVFPPEGICSCSFCLQHFLVTLFFLLSS